MAMFRSRRLGPNRATTGVEDAAGGRNTGRPGLAPPAGPGRDAPGRYRRIIANPFLAFLTLVVWVGLVKVTPRRLEFGWCAVLAMVGLAGIAVLLLQYHCLDCGATGHLARWRTHACLRVWFRQELNRPRRFRGPGPVSQTIGWCLLAALVTLARLWRH
jgi:hypothetical protein